MYWWIYTIAGIVVALLLIVVIICIVHSDKKNKQAKKSTTAEVDENQNNELQQECEQSVATPAQEVQTAEATPVQAPQTAVVETQTVEPIALQEPAQSAVKPVRSRQTAKKPTQTKDEPTPNPEEEGDEIEVESTERDKRTTKTYHISKRKSDGMWQIKLAGGKKAIKLFRTQQDAIDYCKVLAEKQEANLTVHKKDGAFRKRNY